MGRRTIARGPRPPMDPAVRHSHGTGSRPRPRPAAGSVPDPEPPEVGVLSEAVVAGGAHVGEHANRLAPFSEPVGQAVLARCELDEMKARDARRIQSHTQAIDASARVDHERGSRSLLCRTRNRAGRGRPHRGERARPRTQRTRGRRALSRLNRGRVRSPSGAGRHRHGGREGAGWVTACSGIGRVRPRMPGIAPIVAPTDVAPPSLAS